MLSWVDTILQGVLLGGLYALFAMGQALIFGVMRLTNTAHGDFIILAAFAGFSLALSTGLTAAAARWLRWRSCCRSLRRGTACSVSSSTTHGPRSTPL
jgi:branched-subunit amino acid ABC-type transport system permease component